MDKRKDKLTFTVIYRDASTRPTGGNGKKGKKKYGLVLLFLVRKARDPECDLFSMTAKRSKKHFSFSYTQSYFQKKAVYTGQDGAPGVINP